MKQLASIFGILGTALLLSLSASYASDCKDDPEECTPKNLCEFSTEIKDGNKIWSTSPEATKHISFAQNLGMSCNVVEIKAPCDTDPNECKIKQLCEKATLVIDGNRNWNKDAKDYVALAKEYGLKCDVEEHDIEEEASTISGQENKFLTIDDLEVRDGAYYIKTSDIPFTGEIRGRVMAMFKDGERVDGLYTEYWENGQLGSKGNYKDRKWHGLWEYYHENGQLSMKGNYNEGGMEGLWEYYYRNGQLRQKGNYKDRRKEGLWEYYDKNGQLWMKGNYKDGEQEGLWEWYHENGKLRKKENYKVGYKEQVDLFEKSHFLKLTFTERKQLQYGLKKLGYYKSAIDGIYGPRTEKAARDYVNARDIKSTFPYSVLNKVKSEVDVPSSFKTQTKTYSSGSSNNTNSGWVPLSGKPKLPFNDAKDICEAKGIAEANGYMRGNRKKSSSNVNCYGYGKNSFSCRSQSEYGGGWAAGVLEAWDAADLRSQARKLGQAVAKACMADYGWIKR